MDGPLLCAFRPYLTRLKRYGSGPKKIRIQPWLCKCNAYRNFFGTDPCIQMRSYGMGRLLGSDVPKGHRSSSYTVDPTFQLPNRQNQSTRSTLFATGNLCKRCKARGKNKQWIIRILHIFLAVFRKRLQRALLRKQYVQWHHLNEGEKLKKTLA